MWDARVPVQGTLVAADADAVMIRREDGRAGVVHVHFPRIGSTWFPRSARQRRNRASSLLQMRARPCSCPGG